MGGSYRKLRKSKPLVLKSRKLVRKHKRVVQDCNVHKAWVDQSNANKNYNTIGLVIDANHPEKAKPVEVPINVIPEFHEYIPYRGKNYMKPEDRKYITALLDRYNDNFQKMFMDIKLNYKQLTKRELEKMAERYKKYLVEKELWEKQKEEKRIKEENEKGSEEEEVEEDEDENYFDDDEEEEEDDE